MYIEDRTLEVSTSDHPGPWMLQQRVYQLTADQKAGLDWFGVFETAKEANGKKIPSECFWIDSCLVGTAEWLQLDEHDLANVRVVKKFPIN